MSDAALLLVLAAAMLHATWNYLLKKCGGGLGVLALSAIVACTLLTPISLYLIIGKFSFTPAMIGMMLGSGVIHMAYFLLLDRAYRGDSKGGGRFIGGLSTSARDWSFADNPRCDHFLW